MARSAHVATDHFSASNKLGEGGFGMVYKGKLLDGQEIAVKRLSKVSGQGSDEFKNELTLITKVQHVNLVRLVGYSVNGDEKLLIYEFMENGSLDLYLFDETQSCNLNWSTRFEIIKGIARGLLYLHQDSAILMIHRDLKPGNVLLDKDMTPKISDFGMARIFGRGKNNVNTAKVVGTYGYMSPEYAQDGTYSVKSDVFSFGVVMLEILSGKRNKGFARENDGLSLLSHAWTKWTKGEWACVIDPIVDPSSEEVKRCFQISLLCVQDRPEDRPNMSSVVMMLVSRTETIGQPHPPGYYYHMDGLSVPSSSNSEISTQNRGYLSSY
ncbi:Receptor-like serine/threonine-protein kinase SD1-7 [Cardamine amara subsp. amara]|uniref:non-specific serine/threonine protein kinase n=1 Tax=Cardamine amara subsp. amara TaxID=228776 RepID=A0ABD1A0W4_CARAN